MNDPTSAPTYDVVVVGGGFAGLRAARDLRDAGRSVLIVEGRDRLGGRTWTRPFPGTDQKVELGGTWVSPSHHRFVAGDMERYGLTIAAPDVPMERFAWGFGGEVLDRFPLQGDEFYELERALFRIMQAADRIDPTRARDLDDLGDLDVSVREFLDDLSLSSRTQDFLEAFGSLGSGAAAADWSVLTALSLMAGFGGSAYAWFAGVSEKIAGGTGALIAAMAADAGADLEFSTRVTRIEDHGGGVVVHAEDGRTFAAAAAVVALPVNTWGDVEFSPPLRGPKAILAATPHPNEMVKVWILADGVPEGGCGFGVDSELLFVAPQYIVDGRSLLVGFSSPPRLLDPTDPRAVEAALRHYYPDASVVASDAHDWNGDPFAKGGWLTFRPGQLTTMASALQAPEGRLLFAGADIATTWIGWIDGALETGSAAARAAQGLLGVRAADGGHEALG